MRPFSFYGSVRIKEMKEKGGESETLKKGKRTMKGARDGDGDRDRETSR
jgi:hypothetical protein